MTFEWVNINTVQNDVLRKFDSGNQTYNDLLVEKLKLWQDNGEMTTYVAIDPEQINNDITDIFAYASINATGLMHDLTNDRAKYLSCCEIRLFAIHKGLRGVLDENFVPYSVELFKTFLQDLYQMSTSIIGFRAIYLNSNDEGYHLYTDDAIGFMEPKGFIPATDEEKLDIDGCTPLIFFLNDDGVYKLFE